MWVGPESLYFDKFLGDVEAADLWPLFVSQDLVQTFVPSSLAVSASIFTSLPDSLCAIAGVNLVLILLIVLLLKSL